ncbi:MAG: hypothetical protein U0Q22_11775 [Acidimicrobiales bacterium]
MTEASADPSSAEADEAPIKLFGDPRSAHVQRGPERRSTDRPNVDHAAADLAAEAHLDQLRADNDRYAALAMRSPAAARALRLGRGDGFATALNLLGGLVFGASVIAGAVILYNARSVGAFSNPWNSNRVAIGLAVLGVGISQAAMLVGLARVLTYQLATVRLRLRELDNPGTTSSPNG